MSDFSGLCGSNPRWKESYKISVNEQATNVYLFCLSPSRDHTTPRKECEVSFAFGDTLLGKFSGTFRFWVTGVSVAFHARGKHRHPSFSRRNTRLSTLPSPMASLSEEIESVRLSADSALESVTTASALEAWRITHLGASGSLKSIMARLKDAPREEKPLLGKLLNELKQHLECEFETRKLLTAATLAEPSIDLTEPGERLGQGRRHILSRTIDEIVDVFGRMGFSVADGPEIEDEWHNFTALNIPEGHPARDATDNFYMGDEAGVKRLLRTQTSTVQIRAMESQPLPLKVVAVGRVYRPDTHDATHFSMFHQIEGLCIDRTLSMVDLKTALLQFARSYFGPEAEVRMRPSFFPFTEPSAEVDMKMHIRGQWQWVEIGGCGMVDPNVLTAVGIDPEQWRGYAFGLGIERIAMRRYGISDIRLLFENDARFLRQF